MGKVTPASGWPTDLDNVGHTSITHVIPVSMKWLLDAFELTFQSELVDLIIEYTNQRHERHCQ